MTSPAGFGGSVRTFATEDVRRGGARTGAVPFPGAERSPGVPGPAA